MITKILLIAAAISAVASQNHDTHNHGPGLAYSSQSFVLHHSNDHAQSHDGEHNYENNEHYEKLGDNSYYKEHYGHLEEHEKNQGGILKTFQYGNQVLHNGHHTEINYGHQEHHEESHSGYEEHLAYEEKNNDGHHEESHSALLETVNYGNQIQHQQDQHKTHIVHHAVVNHGHNEQLENNHNDYQAEKHSQYSSNEAGNGGILQTVHYGNHINLQQGHQAKHHGHRVEINHGNYKHDGADQHSQHGSHHGLLKTVNYGNHIQHQQGQNEEHHEVQVDVSNVQHVENQHAYYDVQHVQHDQSHLAHDEENQNLKTIHYGSHIDHQEVKHENQPKHTIEINHEYQNDHKDTGSGYHAIEQKQHVGSLYGHFDESQSGLLNINHQQGHEQSYGHNTQINHGHQVLHVEQNSHGEKSHHDVYDEGHGGQLQTTYYGNHAQHQQSQQNGIHEHTTVVTHGDSAKGYHAVEHEENLYGHHGESQNGLLNVIQYGSNVNHQQGQEQSYGHNTQINHGHQVLHVDQNSHDEKSHHDVYDEGHGGQLQATYYGNHAQHQQSQQNGIHEHTTVVTHGDSAKGYHAVEHEGNLYGHHGESQNGLLNVIQYGSNVHHQQGHEQSYGHNTQINHGHQVHHVEQNSHDEESHHGLHDAGNSEQFKTTYYGNHVQHQQSHQNGIHEHTSVVTHGDSAKGYHAVQQIQHEGSLYGHRGESQNGLLNVIQYGSNVEHQQGHEQSNGHNTQINHGHEVYHVGQNSHNEESHHGIHDEEHSGLLKTTHYGNHVQQQQTQQKGIHEHTSVVNHGLKNHHEEGHDGYYAEKHAHSEVNHHGQYDESQNGHLKVISYGNNLKHGQNQQEDYNKNHVVISLGRQEQHGETPSEYHGNEYAHNLLNYHEVRQHGQQLEHYKEQHGHQSNYQEHGQASSAQRIHLYEDGYATKHIEYYGHPKYEFTYEVKDPHTKDRKYQHEVRDGDAVEGVYSLEQPDGTVRVVKYHADKKSGFNADVKYEGHAVHTVVEDQHHH